LINETTAFHRGIISADCRLAAIGSTKGEVQIWDLQQRTLLCTLPVSTERVEPLDFLLKSKKLFVYREDDSSIREWDIARKVETGPRTIAPRTGQSPKVAVTADEQWVLLFRDGGWGRLRQTSTGEERPLDPNGNWSSLTTISPDGKVFANPSNTEIVKLWKWNIETGKVSDEHAFERFMLGAHTATFSPDGKQLAAASGGHESIREVKKCEVKK